MFVVRLMLVAALLSQMVMVTQSLLITRSTMIRSFLHTRSHHPIISRSINLHATENNNGGERNSFFSNLRKQWSNLTGSTGSGESSGNGDSTSPSTGQTKVTTLPKTKVLIVGAGLSGLACANELTKNGMTDFLVMETSDGPGGRVRTDVCDGYLLDRGFQVFIDSYPEAQELFDYPSLQLRVTPFTLAMIICTL